MQIGGEIHKQSKIIKDHPQLPHDLKYSFLTKMDLLFFRYKSDAYQTYTYLQKILKWSNIEVMTKMKENIDFFNIDNKTDLINHFKACKMTETVNYLKSLDDEEQSKVINELIDEMNNIKKLEVIRDLYTNDENFIKSLAEFRKEYKINNEYIDDIGLINCMMSIIETSKGYGGKGVSSMNTTINVTKNEDIIEEVREHPEESENKAGFKFFGGKK